MARIAKLERAGSRGRRGRVEDAAPNELTIELLTSAARLRARMAGSKRFRRPPMQLTPLDAQSSRLLLGMR